MFFICREGDPLIQGGSYLKIWLHWWTPSKGVFLMEGAYSRKYTISVAISPSVFPYSIQGPLAARVIPNESIEPHFENEA